MGASTISIRGSKMDMKSIFYHRAAPAALFLQRMRWQMAKNKVVVLPLVIYKMGAIALTMPVPMDTILIC